MMGKSWRAPLAAAVACWGLVACGGGSGGVPVDDPASVVLSINSTVTGAPVTSINIGDSARLTWSSSLATSCTASGNWDGPKDVSSTGLGELAGPFNVAGTYTYTLSCTGPGGADTDTKSLVVGFAAQGPQTRLTISPNPIQPGQIAKLSWTSTSTTGCTTGDGPWQAPGARAVSSPTGGESTGIIVAEGEYSFSLSCTGSGGSSTDVEVLTVDADAPPVLVPFLNLSATKLSVQPGETTTLNWSSNATSCRADGPWPLGSGMFGGTRSASGSETTAALDEPFPKVYTLTCRYSNGATLTSNPVTISKAPPTAPMVDLNIDSISAAVADSGKLSWEAKAASGAAVNCVADTKVNGVSAPSASWTGNRPAESAAAGEVVGPYIDIAGVPYTITYTLSCTAENPALIGADSVTVTVNPIVQPVCDLTGVLAPAAILPPAIPATLIRALNKGVSVASATNGICLLCGVSGLTNVIDANQVNSALISVPVTALNGTTSVTVTDDNVIYPGGSVGGMILSIPGPSALSLELLGGIQVETLLNGVSTAVAALPTTTVDLELLGLVDLVGTVNVRFFLPLQSPSPFNQVRVTKTGVVGVLQDLSVYNACVIRSGPAPAGD